MIPESNEKHEENKKKRFNIAETWGTLNEAQMNLVALCFALYLTRMAVIISEKPEDSI